MGSKKVVFDGSNWIEFSTSFYRGLESKIGLEYYLKTFKTPDFGIENKKSAEEYSLLIKQKDEAIAEIEKEKSKQKTDTNDPHLDNQISVINAKFEAY